METGAYAGALAAVIANHAARETRVMEIIRINLGGNVKSLGKWAQ